MAFFKKISPGIEVVCTVLIGAVLIWVSLKPAEMVEYITLGAFVIVFALGCIGAGYLKTSRRQLKFAIGLCAAFVILSLVDICSSLFMIHFGYVNERELYLHRAGNRLAIAMGLGFAIITLLLISRLRIVPKDSQADKKENDSAEWI